MYMKKISLMHHLFGKLENHKCGECSNFCEYRYENAYKKCKVYGRSSSEASDWKKKYDACGMFNKEWDKKPVMGTRVKENEPELEGQISLFGGEVK